MLHVSTCVQYQQKEWTANCWQAEKRAQQLRQRNLQHCRPVSSSVRTSSYPHAYMLTFKDNNLLCFIAFYTDLHRLKWLKWFRHLCRTGLVEVWKIWSENPPLFIRAMLKNWCGNILWYLFSEYLYCIVTRIVLWSPCQNLTWKFSDTKAHICTLFPCFQFQYVQLKCKSVFKFHFSFWCYGRYISVLGSFSITSKQIGKEILN